MLPYIAKLVSKWANINPDLLNPDQYHAHKMYTNTLRNMLNSPIALDRALKDEEALQDL